MAEKSSWIRHQGRFFIPTHLVFRKISKPFDLVETAAKCSEGPHNRIRRQNWARIFFCNAKGHFDPNFGLNLKMIARKNYPVSRWILRSNGVGIFEKIPKISKNERTDHGFLANYTVHWSIEKYKAISIRATHLPSR